MPQLLHRRAAQRIAQGMIRVCNTDRGASAIVINGKYRNGAREDYTPAAPGHDLDFASKAQSEAFALKY